VGRDRLPASHDYEPYISNRGRSIPRTGRSFTYEPEENQQSRRGSGERNQGGSGGGEKKGVNVTAAKQGWKGAGAVRKLGEA